MDWQFVQPIFSWLSENPAWSGFFVFLIAFSESLLIIGLIVPGTVLMFGVGTLVGTGVLDMRETLLMAFFGAVLGDGLSYWIGAKYHQQLSTIWPLRNNPDYLNRGKRYFEKHGGKSVFFGRFIGPIRPFIPAVAGMMNMPGKYFFAVNIVSAAAWAPFYLLPGVVFGTSMGLASIVGTRLLIILLVLAVSTFTLVWVIRKMMLYAAPRMESFYLKGYRIAAVNSLFGSAVKAIIDPDTAERRGLYYFSILIFLSLLLFTLFLVQFSSPTLLMINETVGRIVLLIRSEFADQLLLVVWEYYSWPGIILTLIFGFLALKFYRQTLALKHLFLLLVLVISTAFFLNFIANAIQNTSIFVNVKIVVFSAYLSFFALFISHHMLSQQHNFGKRWAIFSLFGLIVLLLVMTELYFGKSNIASVISSLCIAYLWVLLITTALRRHSISRAKIKLKPMLISMSLVFFMTGSFWLMSKYENDYLDLAINNKKLVLTYQQWIDDYSANLHTHRQDMFGINKQDLNIQWAGSLVGIEATLKKMGWQQAVIADYRTILFWLKPDVNLRELPRIQQTHQGSKEVLTMLKYDSNQETVIVLQFWPSKYTIGDDYSPLWLGSITRQARNRNTKWLASLNVKSLASKEMTIFEESINAQSFFVQRTKSNKKVILLIGQRKRDEK